MDTDSLWSFLPIGYALTVLIEIPVLLIGLSSRRRTRDKLLAGVWLTACTYPIVVLVLPILFQSNSRLTYLIVAEIFAPVAECLLFYLAFYRPSNRFDRFRDMGTIVSANLISFGLGEWMTPLLREHGFLIFG